MKILRIFCLLAVCSTHAMAGTVTLMSPAGVPIVPPVETGNGASLSQPPPGAASADGRWIAFASTANNLVYGQTDTNSANDVFLRDCVNGTIVLVSHLPGSLTATANGASDQPSISADGRWIAFVSAATNLVSGQTDGNAVQDVFLYDRTTGQVILLSHAAGIATTTAGKVSDKPVVGADGTVVAFRSAALNLIAGLTDSNAATDLFLYDVAAGTTALASRTAASATTTANGVSDAPALSADGRYLAFTCTGTNLVTGQTDTNAKADVFVHDRTTGAAVLASHSSASAVTATNGLSDQPAISADGSWVAFRTAGTNLGVSDVNVQPDIWAFDRAAGTTLLVSRRALVPLRTGDSASATPALSSDGRFIAYTSAAGNLVTGQTNNGYFDVFVFDRTALLNTLVSRASTGAATEANAGSTSPAISSDGAWIAYLSDSTNVIAGQTDANQAQATKSDVFVFDRAAGTNTLASRSSSSTTTTANRSSDRAAVAAGNGFVVFTSAATDVLTGITDANSANDVFAWERATGTNTVVSRRDTGPIAATANGHSKPPGLVPTALSADGRWAVVVSDAANLVAGITDTNAANDVFLFDRDTGTLTLVSRTAASATTTGNGASDRAAVSADGNWITYVSTAKDLVAGFTTPYTTQQVFLWERATGTAILVSRQIGTTTAASNQQSVDPVVSDDGGVVAFVSHSTDLVAGQVDAASSEDVFYFDRATGIVTLASSTGSSPVTAANNRSYRARLSGNGQWLAFNTYATNLVTGATDTNGNLDIYLVEIATGAKTIVSHAHSSALQTASYGASLYPSLSADGRFLAFESQGINLVAGQVDANNGGDVFLFDRTTGTNILVTHTPAGAVYASDYGGDDAQVSADGNWVAFVSRATNLFATPDANGTIHDVVLYELATGNLTLVSHTAASLTTTSNDSSSQPAVSADGGAVAFRSNSIDLVSGQIDPLVNGDVFLYDRATGAITLASRDLASPVTAGNGTSLTYPPRTSISADGGTLIFATDSSNLVSNDVNGLWDAFLFQP